jgi:hypothetical protein
MKAIGIDALLRWACCDELPKAQAIGEAVAAAAPRPPGNHWKGTASVGELLTMIDARYNAFGVVADPLALEPPHPDAVVVGALVAELSGLSLDVPEGWCPLADFVAAGAMSEDEAAAATVRGLSRVLRVDAEGRRGAGERTARLVMRHAVLGGAPDFVAEAPERKLVSKHGKPQWFRRSEVWAGAVDGDGNGIAGMGRFVEVEVDGYCAKRKRPWPDAYQKHVFDPDPADAVVMRADYALWHAALGWLAAEVAGRLEAFVVCESGRAAEPWMAVDGAGPWQPVVHLARPWDGEVALLPRKHPRALGPLPRSVHPVVSVPLDSAAVA